MSHSPNIKKINAYKPDTDSSATRVGAIKPSAIIVKLSVYFESLFSNKQNLEPILANFH